MIDIQWHRLHTKGREGKAPAGLWDSLFVLFYLGAKLEEGGLGERHVADTEELTLCEEKVLHTSQNQWGVGGGRGREGGEERVRGKNVDTCIFAPVPIRRHNDTAVLRHCTAALRNLATHTTSLPREVQMVGETFVRTCIIQCGT